MICLETQLLAEHLSAERAIAACRDAEAYG